MKRLGTIALFILVLISTATLLADVLTSGPKVEPKPYSDGHVTISWQKDNESGVLRYEIWRARVDGANEPTPGEYSKITELTQLAGSGYTYTFTDENAFKTSAGVFAYKIRVVFTNQSFMDSPSIKTMVLSSTAKRTWGSIKAMFR